MAESIKIPVYSEEKNTFEYDLEAMLGKETLDIFNLDATLLAKKIKNPLKIKVGDKAPFFKLPNANGTIISMESLINKGPVVVTFYRGNWCPYCNLVLNAYQRIVPEIKAFGANLIAISPQNPVSSLYMQAKHDLGYDVLSDAGNSVAKLFTTIIDSETEIINEAQKLGVDFYDFYDFYNHDTKDIPVPAVFIIDKNGTIVFAKSENGDYRLRVEPQDILDALSNISGF
ncbi:peroxiredoxin-like family protein [Flavobacterium paronense]|uniref:thioredoxin-dependent peroxiredoxin n=1 Tax=Flavobacterium paronense TaxID=1392775 RepID=A0ABV5GBL1_9FLAO|nr:peroxiredoxin-like family protein [Flavobacterium paronense]MDN3677661.1 peroxiredoxin-like family protein [Flavobacterium paronense]